MLLLNIDVLGFWDLAEKRYGFLAALRDSSVAGIDLTGGLPVWGEYGNHPRSSSPPVASTLASRTSLRPWAAASPAEASFSVGRFDLTLTGCFAVTPATIQAGLNLHASARSGRSA